MPHENKKFPYKLRLGLDTRNVTNLHTFISDNLDMTFDFAMVDLTHQLNFRDEKTIVSRDIAHTRSDTSVKYTWWQEVIYGKINNMLVHCDSPIPHIQ
jgi:hypothetical protein